MEPLRIVETDRDDFDEPVVEIWRDDEFIGMVFWDDDTAFVQIYTDDDGDVKDVDVRELLRVLEMAERIVSPLGHEDDFEELRATFGSERGADEWTQEHPATLTLVGEFDEQAVHRTPDGEGFFAASVAQKFIERCEELDLAVVEMEGFDLDEGSLVARPGLNLMIEVDGPTDWETFRATANGRCLGTLGDWPDRETLVVAFVVQQPDRETFVA